MSQVFGQKDPDEVRRRTTATIWRYATGMLFVSIPLVGISHSTLMPFAIVFCAALGTAAVWAFKDRDLKSASELAALEKRLRQLDERLSNVETISRFDRLLAEKSASQQSKSN